MATVLIVDTQNEFRKALQNVLEKYGHTVMTAETGEEVLQALERNLPDVVLLDLALRGKAGLKVLAHLRAASPQTPVVVVTESLTPDAESRVRALGVTDILRKDLKMNNIMQAVNHAVPKRGGPSEKAPHGLPPVQAAQSAGRILIVDDEQEICEMVGEFLSRRNCHVQTANSGAIAFELIEKEAPDLIILDIYMPGMNGVDVMRKLQERNLLSKLGVIILSASQEEPLLQEALDIGAFDVLSKPVDLEELELAVMVKLVLSEVA